MISGCGLGVRIRHKFDVIFRLLNYYTLLWLKYCKRRCHRGFFLDLHHHGICLFWIFTLKYSYSWWHEEIVWGTRWLDFGFEICKNLKFKWNFLSLYLFSFSLQRQSYNWKKKASETFSTCLPVFIVVYSCSALLGFLNLLIASISIHSNLLALKGGFSRAWLPSFKPLISSFCPLL